MRSRIVFAIVAALAITLVAAFSLRGPRGPGPGPSASAPASGAPAGDPRVPPEEAPRRLLDRPLSIAASGWDLAAPALLANGGPAPAASGEFASAGLEARLSVVGGVGEALAAIARGGADTAGADVGIASLPALVAAHEELAALDLEIFFLVGFSRGRHALYALPGPLLTRAPVVDGAPGEAAALLGLLVLDWEGMREPRLAAEGEAANAPLVAIDRAALSDAAKDPSRELLMTTAQATHLVPYVAFARRSLIAEHPAALEAFVRAYLAGVKALTADPPEAARKVAQAPGAPPPLTLLERLGEIAPATLEDNVRGLGLSGSGAARVGRLFALSFRLWREAGVLAAAPPEAPPVATSVVAGLAREAPPPVPAPEAKAPPATEGKVLVTYRHLAAKVDEPALLEAVGLAASIFSRSTLRISVGAPGRIDTGRTKKLLGMAARAFDLPASRLVAAKRPIPGTPAAIEVLSAP